MIDGEELPTRVLCLAEGQVWTTGDHPEVHQGLPWVLKVGMRLAGL